MELTFTFICQFLTHVNIICVHIVFFANHVDDFAKMLEHLFHGDPAPPMPMPTLTEPPWTMAQLKHAISRLKSKKSGDDLGLVAELLKHSPDDFLNALLLVMKEVLTSGNVPSSWQRTFLKMLPKTKAAKSVSDFRPIANVRLLYKLFAYLKSYLVRC